MSWEDINKSVPKGKNKNEVGKKVPVVFRMLITQLVKHWGKHFVHLSAEL